MLVLPIVCDNGCPEWSMIEMQGELERKDLCSPDEEFPVGKLTLSAKVLNACLMHKLRGWKDAGHWTSRQGSKKECKA